MTPAELPPITADGQARAEAEAEHVRRRDAARAGMADALRTLAARDAARAAADRRAHDRAARVAAAWDGRLGAFLAGAMLGTVAGLATGVGAFGTVVAALAMGAAVLAVGAIGGRP